ncbi:MAG: hypothetical protein JJ902_05475 [Roseibium sp.]|nr:hypothetical protein [Roseibium sp.]
MLLYNSQYLIQDGKTKLNAAFLGRVFQSLDSRLHEQELIQKDWEAQAKQLVQLGQERIDIVLQPLVAEVLDLASMGFLMADLDGAVPFQTGTQTVTLAEGTARDLFVLSPFLSITRADNHTDYLICKPVGDYDSATGQLAIDVIEANGAVGPHSDCVIALTAAGGIAGLLLKQGAVTAKDEAEAARDAAQGHAGDAAQRVVDAQAQVALAAAEVVNAAAEVVNAQTEVVNAQAEVALAAGHKTAAEAARDAALAAQAAAEGALDAFEDKFLGSFTTANEPVTDNDGDPLQEGMFYWNSDVDALFFWTGSAWLQQSVSTTAGTVTVVPPTGMTGTNVQAALQELSPTLQAIDPADLMGDVTLDLILTSVDGFVGDFARASAGTYFDAQGVLQTAAADVPRFDHDPVTGAPRGLLVEGAATNLLAWPEDFSAPDWLPADATPTANSASNTADSGHIRIVINGITPDTDYTVSYELDLPVQRTQIQWNFDTGGTTIRHKIDIHPDGTLVALTSGGATIPADYRKIYQSSTKIKIKITGNSGASNTRAAVFLYPSSNAAGVSGTITNMKVQLETGTIATSYIKCEGVATSRAADVAVLSNIAELLSESGGTIYVEAVNSGFQTGAFPWPLSLNDGTTDNEIGFFHRQLHDDWYFKINNAGVSQSQIGGFPNSSINKLAAAFFNDDLAFSANGTSVVVDGSATIPTTLTEMMLGAGANGNSANWHIPRVIYSKTVNPAPILEAITS